MECTAALVSRFKISASRLVYRLPSVIGTALAILGGLVTVLELAEICGLSLPFKQMGVVSFLVALLAAVVIALVYRWDHLEVKATIDDSPDVTIVLKVCDALKNDGAIVVPTNTTFDTTMVDEFISVQSLQGQYQMQYFDGCLSELDDLLEKGLAQKQYIALNDGRTSKRCRYPIGTVCKVLKNGKRAYFLADSDINNLGVSEGIGAEDLAKTLVGLWEALVEIGNREPYSIPLIGTGRAGIRDV